MNKALMIILIVAALALLIGGGIYCCNKSGSSADTPKTDDKKTFLADGKKGDAKGEGEPAPKPANAVPEPTTGGDGNEEKMIDNPLPAGAPEEAKKSLDAAAVADEQKDAEKKPEAKIEEKTVQPKGDAKSEAAAGILRRGGRSFIRNFNWGFDNNFIIMPTRDGFGGVDFYNNSFARFGSIHNGQRCRRLNKRMGGSRFDLVNVRCSIGDRYQDGWINYGMMFQPRRFGSDYYLLNNLGRRSRLSSGLYNNLFTNRLYDIGISNQLSRLSWEMNAFL